MHPLEKPFNKPPAGLVRAACSTLESQIVCTNNIHKLYRRILEQAIHDLFDRHITIRAPAVEWLWSPDDKYPWSMIVICHHIQLDPGYVRHVVQQLTDGGE